MASLDPGLVLAFWGVALLLIVVPGPDWAFVLAVGLRERRVAPAVGGLMLGYLLLTAVVAGGVGALVAGAPIVLTVLTVAGAGYLIYLGVRILAGSGVVHRDSSAPAVAEPTVAEASWRTLIRGVGVSSLNPKGLLVFLAMLPQFIRSGGWWTPLQLGVLGLVFVITCGLFYTALGAGVAAVLRARPAITRRVSQVSGATMIVIAVVLLIERFVTKGLTA